MTLLANHSQARKWISLANVLVYSCQMWISEFHGDRTKFAEVKIENGKT